MLFLLLLCIYFASASSYRVKMRYSSMCLNKSLKDNFKQLPLGLKSMTPSVDRVHYEISISDPHPKLIEYVNRNIRIYKTYLFNDFVTNETLLAHEKAKSFVNHFYEGRKEIQESPKVILDSGCGRGLSTIVLGKMYPDLPVIGIDRSHDRLSTNQLYVPLTGKNTNLITKSRKPMKDDDDEDEDDHNDGNFDADHNLKEGDIPRNVLLLRAELGTFWKLTINSNWIVDKHFLLYPNPYGKAGAVKHRFQAQPTIMSMAILGGDLHIRSTWDTYCKEFSMALDTIKTHCAHTALQQMTITDITSFTTDKPMTHHERKYLNVGLPLYQMDVHFGDRNLSDRMKLLEQWPPQTRQMNSKF